MLQIRRGIRDEYAVAGRWLVRMHYLNDNSNREIREVALIQEYNAGRLE